jgi:outer membrane protein OmpA-like peptidoglycan-associated protein
MFARHQKSRAGSLANHITRVAIAAGVVMTLSIGFASAGDDNTNTVSSDQILQALTPKRLTRSLTAAPAAEDPAKTAAEAQFVQSIKNRTTRSLSSGERDQIYAIAQQKPNIDLEITFDYNSANISKSALPQVDALGKALTDPSLKGTTFVVAGHTDAVGSDNYNQDLSERRADSVKQYLTTKYGMAAADLVTVGYGKTRLKNPNDPKGGENRRVQVVNMASTKAASN